ncbi:MAG: Na(+)/H(+) antiporter subunit B [Pseudomonadota bacterium]|nr:Na(+)/H(+) antiporter subunit B [Pseudomonadota bacterium]
MHKHLILKVVTKSLVGLILLFGLYVQFHGDYSPGGGFQAGVIFAAAFILYGVVMGLERVQSVLSFGFVTKMSALGVLIYALTGVYSLLAGFRYLDYGALSPQHPEHGQHYGILIVELGVGITVAGVIMCIYYCFASRTPHLDDQEW